MRVRLWPAGALIVILGVVAVAGLTLTGLTFGRWLDSYLTLRHFEVEFAALDQRRDRRQMEITIVLDNGGEVATHVESLHIMLRHEDRLIASERLFPSDLILRAGETLPMKVEMVSKLDPEQIPGLTKDNRDRWNIRANLRISHPVREGVLQVTKDERLIH